MFLLFHAHFKTKIQTQPFSHFPALTCSEGAKSLGKNIIRLQ